MKNHDGIRLTMEDGISSIWGKHTEDEETNHAPHGYQCSSMRSNINYVRSRVNTVTTNVNNVRSRQPVPTRTSNSFSPKRPRDHPLKNMVDRGIFDSGCSGHMTGTSQTPNSNASEEKDEGVELIVMPSANLNKRKMASSTDTKKIEPSKDNPKILAFRRELEEIALKHLGTVSENNATSTPSVILVSEPFNTGIFDEASYDEEGVITDFNSLPTEIEVSPTPTLRIHNIHPKSQILGDPKSAVQTRSKDKYVAEILKKFDLVNAKAVITPMETKVALTKDEEAINVDVTLKISHLNAVKRIFKYLKGKPNLGLWYPRESPFDLEAFSGSDYVATSTTEAEYVAAANCCGQVLWVQNQLLDYGFNFMNTKIHIDNESTICIVKNPVYHSKTKHIEIRHHFIRDCYEKKLISVEKIHTDLNVADLLTKPFDGPRFNYLVVSIVYINTGSYVILILVVKHSMDVQMKGRRDKTATANTIADGTLEIHATIDTTGYTITEASIRVNASISRWLQDYNVAKMMRFLRGWAKMGLPSHGTYHLLDKAFSHPIGDIVVHIFALYSSKMVVVIICHSQPSSSTLPAPSTSSPPVQSPPPTSSPPVQSPPPTFTPTPTPIPASIPTPTPIPETEPEPIKHTFEEPSLAHQHFSPPTRTGLRTDDCG
ncbi:hypothetical protein Tco_1476270 [Tanacetum coccineum]